MRGPSSFEGRVAVSLLRVALLGVALSVGFPLVGMGPERSGAFSSPPQEITVECNASACFGLVGEAIERAPEDALLTIRPGSYYEFPLSVTKSLTIRGEDYRTTLIRALEPGALFTVRPSGGPLRVTFQELTLRNLEVALDGPSSSVFRVEGPVAAEGDSVTVSLQGIWADSAGVGVRTEGEVRLEIRASWMYTRVMPVVLVSEGGTLVLEESRLSATSDAGGLGLLALLSSDAVLRKNLLIPFGEASIPVALYGSQGEYTLVDNEFAFVGIGATFLGPSTRAFLSGNYFRDMVTGVALAGETNATLLANVFRYNDVGLLLYLPPCVSLRQDDPLRFRGAIEGQDNVFESNDADLCPEGYPWPEAFKKSP